MQTLPLDPLSATFQALADPTRRAILARLATGACSVTELAEPFDMSMPAVSKHLRVLERAGLISRSRDAQRRPCRIEPEALKRAWEWAGGFQAIWQQRLDSLEEYMTQLQSAQQFSGPPAHQPSSPATHQKKERPRARRKQ
ncbi:MAG: ArsR/SmtB family transcription factor [Vicinamibacterales bacterium]